MRRTAQYFLIAAWVILIAGCGGGGGAPASGRAVFTVQWPNRSRLIPLASNSIRIDLLQGTTVIRTQLLARPPDGTSTTATFNNLPVKSLTVRASAYPTANGDGTAQASGLTTLNVLPGKTAAITLTMDSTIDHLEVAPTDPVVKVGETVQLTATAKDAAGAVVLLSASKLVWSSSDASKATVSSDGLVSGVSSGAPDITVTDQESGKSVAVAVTVAEQVFIIDGDRYIMGAPKETMTAAFTPADGGISVQSYQGYVLLNVSGVGQSYGATYNDAFYLYTAPFTTPQNGHDGGFYQLAFGTTTLPEFSLANNAKNFIYGALPAYNPAHEYTVILNTTLSSPGVLHFGVTDGGYSDNTGEYTIKITQLVPAP